MSYFLNWWEKYKRKLGSEFSQLPQNFEDFMIYLDRVPLNLQSKQEIVRMLVKGLLGKEFKRSSKNMKKYRRAMRYYDDFKEKMYLEHMIVFAPAVGVTG